MLTNNIKFKNFSKKFNLKKTLKNLDILLNSNNEIIKSLSTKYKYSYSEKLVKKIKKKFDIKILGIGGSTLGSKAIFDFLNHKIKRKVFFIDNLKKNLEEFKGKTNDINLIISKSGNTLETISNVNILIKNSQKNIFINEKKNSYLRIQAQKLKAEIVDHNNFIGGRYSVLSEVGMLPAELMGLSENKFKQLNNLIKNKNFLKSLCLNVNNTIFFLKKKKI